MQHDEMQVFDAGTHARAWEVEMRDDGQSAVFFFVHNNSATNRQVLSIVQADFSTGLWDVHFDGVLNYIGRPATLFFLWVYRPYGKRERGMLVIDWRKQLYVIFDCTTVSLTQTKVAFVPGNIIFTTTHDHGSVRDFNDLNLSAPTLAAVVERVEDADIRLSRDVQSRVFSHHMHMTLHPNPIRDNAYKLMIYTSNRKWGNKSGFADTLRQNLSWTRVSAVPAVPQIIPPISYAGYAVVWTDRYTREAQVVDARLPRPHRKLLTGWIKQAIREVVVLPRRSNHVSLSLSAGSVVRVEDQHITISHYA
ncbi:hypothetical protein B0H13DRAFT_1951153 [Mycena leptocephala]|nr:hypothetical protein B0H13DRAFT_1951153 [Mycena leptocephala]